MVRGHALDLGRNTRAQAREGWIKAWLRRPRRRRQADALLRASGGRWESHPAVAWRVAELTSPYERRRLARVLESVFDEILDPRPSRSASLLSPSQVRSCVPELSRLADRLTDVSHPVTGAGVLLVRDLLRDGGSPLYLGGNKAGLDLALDRIHDSLEAAA
jgi:hypothetical protein